LYRLRRQAPLCACKSFEGKQDHYVCSKYKSGCGDCSANYIREDVLRELVPERIQVVNKYIRGDVEGFQEEWLHYRRTDQERDIREDHHSRTGQVWWQAQTEGGDHLQLRKQGGNLRAGRTHDCRIYPWTQKNGVTFTVTPFFAQPQDL